MGNHITRYKTENGKTYKIEAENSAAKQTDKNGAQGSPGADNKNNQPGTPAK